MGFPAVIFNAKNKENGEEMIGSCEKGGGVFCKEREILGYPNAHTNSSRQGRVEGVFLLNRTKRDSEQNTYQLTSIKRKELE